MSDKEKLALIKKLHDEANEIVPSKKLADQERVIDILQYLYEQELTDWLIEQAEQLQQYKQATKEG